jgi:hypothetical protein
MTCSEQAVRKTAVATSASTPRLRRHVDGLGADEYESDSRVKRSMAARRFLRKDDGPLIWRAGRSGPEPARDVAPIRTRSDAYSAGAFVFRTTASSQINSRHWPIERTRWRVRGLAAKSVSTMRSAHRAR